MSNKMKSSFKPPIFVSQSSSQSQTSESLWAAVVKQEDVPATVKNTTKDVVNGKKKSGKSAKPKMDVNKENKPPNGIVSAPKNGHKKSSADATPHTSKPSADNPSKKRKPDEAAKPSRPMNDTEYEDIFSSVIAANTCDNEEGEIEEIPIKKAKVSRVAKPKPPLMKISNLDEAAYDDIFASAIAKRDYDPKDMDAGTSTDVVTASKKHKKMPLETLNPIRRKTTPVVLDLIEEVVEEIFEVDDDSDQDDDGEIPMDFGSEDAVHISVDEMDQRPITSAAQKSSGFKVPLLHRSQGTSATSKGSKASSSKASSSKASASKQQDSGKLKRGPSAKANKLPIAKKRKVSLTPSASQSSQRSNTSLHPSQTLSQVEAPHSQPPEHLNPRERLEWLQERRDIGLWVVCDKCDKNRYLPDVKDPLELPGEWFCRMHPDPSLNDCSYAEDGPSLVEQDDLVHNLYTSGSVVWARLDGYPWWPAMVDDCPDVEAYYWLNDFSDIPTHYNVTFFDKDSTSRAWMLPSQLQPYTGREKGSMFKSVAYGENYNARLTAAKSQATEALSLAIAERRKKFSFLARYKGKIGPLRKISVAKIRKELAKMQKGSQLKLSQRELSLLREAEADESSSESASDSVSEFEEECRKDKETQKKTKKRKHSSTAQKKSRPTKTSNGGQTSSEKTRKRKTSKAQAKRVESKQSSAESDAQSSSQSESEKSDSEAEEQRETLDSETYFSLIENAKLQAAKGKQSGAEEAEKSDQEEAEKSDEEGAEKSDEGGAEKSDEEGEEKSDEEEAEKSNEEEAEKSDEEEAEKSGEEEAEKSDEEEAEKVSAVGALSPFSDRSNSPSLLSTPATEQSQKVIEEDLSQAKTTSVIGSQTQRSTQLSYEECSIDETTSQDPTWYPNMPSENAVVPTSSDPQADLDFSQELFDAVVPDVGSSSAISEPYSSEADRV